MRAYFPPVFLLLVLFMVPKANAQDSTLYRSEKPIVLKAGLEGLGVDIAIGRYIAVDVNSLLLQNDIKMRVFLLNRNATPYFGLGAMRRTPIGHGTTEDRFFFHAGWEHAFEKSQVQLGLILFLTESQRNYDWTGGSFYPVVSFGYRF